jgi:hypothetical protein
MQLLVSCLNSEMTMAVIRRAQGVPREHASLLPNVTQSFWILREIESW